CVDNGDASMDQFELATKRAGRRRATQPGVRTARYDPQRDRVILELSTGVDVAFQPRHAQGLETAKPSDLDVIEISPSGFGLHFPKLDADLWVPALLAGALGPRPRVAPPLRAPRGEARRQGKMKR